MLGDESDQCIDQDNRHDGESFEPVSEGEGDSSSGSEQDDDQAAELEDKDEEGRALGGASEFIGTEFGPSAEDLRVAKSSRFGVGESNASAEP